MTNEYSRRIRARIALMLMSTAQARGRFHYLPWANVGQRHPDYGMTAAEHNAAKAARLENV